jgi:sugar transferase (PEP-CTERM system associated)
VAHIRVFNHYVQSPYLLLAFVEFSILALCAYFNAQLTYSLYDPSLINYSTLDIVGLRYALVFALVMHLSTLAMGIYASGDTDGFTGMAVRSIVSFCLLGSSVMVLLPYFFPELELGRRVLFGAVVSSYVLIIVVRRLFYSFFDASQLKKRILILGSGPKALTLQENISSDAGSGVHVVGFIPSSQSNIEIDETRLLDPVEGLQHLVRKHKVDEIVLAVDDRRRDSGGYFPLEELLDCKLSGTKVTEVVKFYERELGSIELAEIHPGWMVFGNGFYYSQLRDASKRVFDIAVCILLLFLAWPLMLLTAVAIFFETGRPVIYHQVRTGLNGKPFSIYKFRSMSKDAEKDGKAVWAKQNDTRVTKVGAFIRNTRLDELPQILNVLIGDMSFVGPRPERPEFVDDLNKQLPYYGARHRVKPGLMGWAQLKYSYGASVEDAANKLKYDLYYVKNHSLLLDILIVVQSVEIILLGKGVR